MTDHHDELATALDALRGEVRDLVPVPDAAGLRARATHRLRVRRVTTAVVAAAAVTAIAVGGNTLLRPTAVPAPPAESTSQRPVPISPEPPDDPIAEVGWESATIDMPPREGCPDGPVTFQPVSDIHPTGIGPVGGAYPQVSIDANEVAYADLGGQVVAVLQATCDAAPSEDRVLDQLLLAVIRETGGSLRGVGWLDPPGTAILSYWVAGHRLVAEVYSVAPGDGLGTTPGLAFAIALDGGTFDGWEQAAEYPPVVPPDLDGPGAPVRPGGAVATGLDCPDQEIRFGNSIDVLEWPWLASTDTDASYGLPRHDDAQPYLFDLDRTGQRLLVLALSCLPLGGSPTHGLAVLERAGEGWQGIGVLTRRGLQPSRWWIDGDRFMVEWRGSGVQQETAYRWTGTLFDPISE
jgi:hypothetical protein